MITPHSLHYGIKDIQANKILDMEEHLTEVERIAYKRRWENIISDHDTFLQHELNEHNKHFKSNSKLKVGDLCLYRNMSKQSKDVPSYIRSIFEITKIKGFKYILKPLFGYTHGEVTAYGNFIKPYSFLNYLMNYLMIYTFLLANVLTLRH